MGHVDLSTRQQYCSRLTDSKAWSDNAFITILRGKDNWGERFPQVITDILACGADGNAATLTTAEAHAGLLPQLRDHVQRRVKKNFGGNEIKDVEDTDLYEVALPVILEKILGTDKELKVEGEVCRPRVKQERLYLVVC